MLRRLFLVLLVLFVLAACQSDNTAEEVADLRASPEVVKSSSKTVRNNIPEENSTGFGLMIIPSPPMVTATQLSLDVSGCQPDQLRDILWQLNDSIVGSNLTLDLGSIKLHRDDTIAVDAECEKTVAQTSTVVANSPPWIEKVELKNPLVTAGQPIVLTAYVFDSDSDAVKIIPDWRVNGELLPDIETLELPAAYVETGARIEVRLTPDDGWQHGRIYVVKEFLVPNQPPRFESSPPQEITAFPYIYDVRAIDPDGDTVTYQLDQGPEGMFIDELSGQLRWTPLSGVYGEFTVKIRIMDSRGQADQQVFTITLSNPEKP